MDSSRLLEVRIANNWTNGSDVRALMNEVSALEQLRDQQTEICNKQTRRIAELEAELKQACADVDQLTEWKKASIMQGYVHGEKRIADLERQLAGSLERERKLRESLKPFADVAKDMQEQPRTDDPPPADRIWMRVNKVVITYGHLESARLAMEPLAKASAEESKPERDERQKQVAKWCAAAFGVDHQSSIPQRGVRLLEESIEAYQAAGGRAEMAHKLVDYTFSRPVGELSQELGGVGIGLLALAEAAGISADAEERRELERVLSKPLEHFTKRNQAKNDAGFNVAAQASAEEP